MDKLFKKEYINFLTIAVLIISFLIALAHHAYADEYRSAYIYYNEACGDCGEYVKEDLVPTFKDLGVSDIKSNDYINNRSFRKELNKYIKDNKIPLELQSHLMTFINGGEVVLSGHIPTRLIRQIFENLDIVPSGLVVYQDKMPGMGEDVKYYTVWAKGIEPIDYPIDTPILSFLKEYNSNPNKTKVNFKESDKSILPVVITSGFLDGINPCAIAVLIFFIAFLFTLSGSLGRIFKYGLLYIFIIYLTYLGIGLGLFKAIEISKEPHFMAKAGSWLIIILGFVNIINYYTDKFPIKLSIPKFSQKSLKSWLTKATLPAVIIGAFLVGLCTFPCSGSIYVAIIGLLAFRGTFFEGLAYLLLYNLMFVVPLLVLLALASNRYTLSKVAKLHSEHDKKLKLVLGIVTVALGAIILLWFV